MTNELPLLPWRRFGDEKPPFPMDEIISFERGVSVSGRPWISFWAGQAVDAKLHDNDLWILWSELLATVPR